jgi:Na+/melibiose symporter-like transporter
MSPPPGAFDIVRQQIDTQIGQFNGRRARFSRHSNILSIAQLVAAAGTTGLVALNGKFDNTFIWVVTIVFSVISSLSIQLLSYFKFQERLQIAVATVSRLRTLRARMELEETRCTKDELALGAPLYFDKFQNILASANFAWSAQLSTTIENRNREHNRARSKDIQPSP